MNIVLSVVLGVLGVALGAVGLLGLQGKLRRNRFVGVRTAAALRDEETFALANRVAGVPNVAAGAVAIVSGTMAFVMADLAVTAGIIGLVGALGIAFAGEVPFEIYAVSLTAEGFRLAFTKPLDPATAAKLAAYAVRSFTYVYHSTYGSPEVDQRAETVGRVEVATDRRSATIAVPGMRKGRVYDIRLTWVKSADGEAVLHPEAYYTVNELVK